MIYNDFYHIVTKKKKRKKRKEEEEKKNFKINISDRLIFVEFRLLYSSNKMND